MRSAPLLRRTALRADPKTTQEFVDRGRRNSKRKPRAVSPASPAQRAKVRDRLCVSCGSLGPCDPSHLTPRAHAGCDHPDCVVPLCRFCHRNFDEEEGERRTVDLEPVLALSDYAAERSHMASHMSLRRCIQRLTGRRLVDESTRV